MLAFWLAIAAIEPLRSSWLEVTVEGCGDADVVRERVASMIRESEPTTLDVRLRSDGERWTVELQLERSGTTSRREFEAESCQAGLDAAALVAALAIDPAAELDAETQPTPARIAPTEPAPHDPVPPEPARAKIGAVRPPDHRSPRRPLAWAVDAGIGVGAGVVPRATTGMVRVLAELGFPRAAAGLGGTYGWPTRVDLEPGAAALLQVWTIDARGCWVIRPARASMLAVPLCGTLRVGAMHGRGRGESIVSRRGHAPWIGAGVVAELRWLSRRRLGAFFAFEGVTLVSRPSFAVDGVGHACCSSAVAGLAVVGASFGS